MEAGKLGGWVEFRFNWELALLFSSGVVFFIFLSVFLKGGQ